MNLFVELHVLDLTDICTEVQRWVNLHIIFFLQDALEIRSYLHDRSLMEYADRLEDSRKSLAELLGTSTLVLSSDFGMKRGHVARFIDRASACRVSMPPSYVLPARERSMSISSGKGDEASKITEKSQYVKTPSKVSSYKERSVEQSAADFKISEGYIFKGTVAAEPAEPRLCGCVQPPPIVEHVAPYSSIENISVQKLTPEYKVGMGRLVTTKAPPMKASELWKEKPTLLLCLRRPG